MFDDDAAVLPDKGFVLRASWEYTLAMSETTTPRCTGHCCRGFALEKSHDEIWDDYRLWKQNPALSTIPDVHLIAPMVIPIKKLKGEWLYTCKHLGKNGDCGIYSERPQMCRDFPGEKPCPFPICSSHGKKSGVSWVVAWLKT